MPKTPTKSNKPTSKEIAKARARLAMAPVGTVEHSKAKAVLAQVGVSNPTMATPDQKRKPKASTSSQKMTPKSKSDSKRVLSPSTQQSKRKSTVYPQKTATMRHSTSFNGRHYDSEDDESVVSNASTQETGTPRMKGVVRFDNEKTVTVSSAPANWVVAPDGKFYMEVSPQKIIQSPDGKVHVYGVENMAPLKSVSAKVEDSANYGFEPVKRSGSFSRKVENMAPPKSVSFNVEDSMSGSTPVCDRSRSFSREATPFPKEVNVVEESRPSTGKSDRSRRTLFEEEDKMVVQEKKIGLVARNREVLDDNFAAFLDFLKANFQTIVAVFLAVLSSHLFVKILGYLGYFN